MESVLKLSSGGLPPLSARGCVQELIPVSHGVFKRTISGKLCFIKGMEEMKFRTIISCEDRAAFALSTLSPGQEVEVSCIQALHQKCPAGEVKLARDPVSGSIETVGLDQKPVKILETKGRTVILSAEGYVSFRPLLNMRVVKFLLKTNEWGLRVGWQLEMEEI